MLHVLILFSEFKLKNKQTNKQKNPPKKSKQIKKTLSLNVECIFCVFLLDIFKVASGNSPI